MDRADLPAHPRMSHRLMMKRIRTEDAGLVRGNCPSLLKPLRLGKICKMAKTKLRAALDRVKTPNRVGWKETTKSVAASRFGQQKVSSRGDAMMEWTEREREGGEGERESERCVLSGVRRLRRKKERERRKNEKEMSESP